MLRICVAMDLCRTHLKVSMCYLGSCLDTLHTRMHNVLAMPLCRSTYGRQQCMMCRSRRVHFFFKYLLASATVICVLAAMLWFIPGFHAWNPIYAMTTVRVQLSRQPFLAAGAKDLTCAVLC